MSTLSLHQFIIYNPGTCIPLMCLCSSKPDSLYLSASPVWSSDLPCVLSSLIDPRSPLNSTVKTLLKNKRRETILRQMVFCFTIFEEKKNSTLKTLYPLKIKGQHFYFVLICDFKYCVCWKCERWRGGNQISYFRENSNYSEILEDKESILKTTVCVECRGGTT